MNSFRFPRLSVNPILVKELRSRMRGVRPYAILSAFILFMIVIGYIIYQMSLSQVRFGATVLSPQVGQSLFNGLALCELFLVIFLAPALTSSAISAEREQLTYDLLVTTPLKPLRILWGKLIAALSYLLLVIFAAIPVFSVVLIFGGVNLRDMIKALLLLLISAIFFGAIGLFSSALCKRTAQATVLSYSIILLILGVSLLLSLTWSRFSDPPGQNVPEYILYANPFSALSSITIITPMDFNSPFPIMFDSSMVYGGLSWQTFLATGVLIYDENGPLVLPIFRATLLLYPFLTLLLCWISSHLILPRRRWWPRWTDLGFLISLAAFGVLIYMLRSWWYVPTVNNLPF